MNPYAVPSSRPAHIAGVETKRVLLTLGAGCLMASLGAGTALIWSALGPGGQFAVMLAVTVALLGATVLLRRLPATAEAVAAVGIAAVIVDTVAARTLRLPFGTAMPTHVYVGCAALAVGTISALLAAAAPVVRGPLATAAVGPTIALVAWLRLDSVSRTALAAPLALVIGVAAERIIVLSGPRSSFARSASGAVVGAVVVNGVLASSVAAYTAQPVAWCGVIACVLVLALPELCGWRDRDGVQTGCAIAAGIGLMLLAIPAGTHVGTGLRLAAIATLPALVGAIFLVPLRGVANRLRVTFVTVAAPVATAAFGSLGGSETSYLAATASLAVACFAASFACPREMRLALHMASSVLAAIAVALGLDLGGVRVIEAYVVTPAVCWTVIGAVEMRRQPLVPSAVLLPGLLMGVVPTLVLALRPDTVRQIALLLVAAAMLAIGAQVRWSTPMAVGAGVVAMLVLRIVGPEVVQLPRWLTLAIVGTALLTLGATWEARVADAQRLSAAVRPRIAALR